MTIKTNNCFEKKSLIRKKPVTELIYRLVDDSILTDYI